MPLSILSLKGKTLKPLNLCLCVLLCYTVWPWNSCCLWVKERKIINKSLQMYSICACTGNGCLWRNYCTLAKTSI